MTTPPRDCPPCPFFALLPSIAPPPPRRRLFMISSFYSPLFFLYNITFPEVSSYSILHYIFYPPVFFWHAISPTLTTQNRAQRHTMRKGRTVFLPLVRGTHINMQYYHKHKYETDGICISLRGTTSRIQELRDDPHVCLSFLPERGVTGVLELDLSGVGNVIEERLDDEILSHVSCTVDHERLHVDVVQTVDDCPPSLDSRSVVRSGSNNRQRM